MNPRSDNRPPAPRLLALLALALPCALACQPQAGAAGLLEGKRPIRVASIDHPERLTDGIAAYEGDDWTSDTAARFTAPDGSAEYDLGEVRTIRCALVQGDNNDVYLLSGSLDQLHWSPLFEALPQSGGGLRTRSGHIELQTRYLRLTASGGDGLYSVSELAVYETCPERGLPALRREHGHSPRDLARRDLERFACALLVLLLFNRLGAPRLNLLLAAIPSIALFSLVRSLIPLSPLFEWETLLRGTVAVLALAALLREAFPPRWHKPDPRYLKGALSLLALGALGCYFHFGSLQFWDNGKQRHTLVHGFDMRHYFPLAKYFRELRFDGLYDASLAAYIDLTPGMTLEKVGNVELRDLSSAEMRHARDLAPQIEAVRHRFTPARWDSFKTDMRYFLESMGRDGYLGTLRDHGGNATPVWLLGAWLLFSHAPASELTLTLAGLIDPLLLLLLIWAVFRSYGARVALYMVILFGATDFYQFGSNMFGSTLRQDWLVAVGLGACALRTRRYSLGGALLAYGGLIRAFPAVAVLMLPVPIFWSLFDQWRARGGDSNPNRSWDWRALLAAQRPAARAIAGAAFALVLLVGTSAALFGPTASWGNWFKKISIHATGPSINGVGLRAALMYEPSHISERVIRHDLPEPWEDWQRYQNEAFARRRWLFLFINAAMIALVLLAARRRPVDQAALLGLLLIPFFFYPSNYYCHYIFLLPLAAGSLERNDPRDLTFTTGVGALLLLCIAQGLTMTLEVGWSDVRYAFQSFELIFASLLFVIPLALRGAKSVPIQPSQPDA